jgi:hypothetical protein
MEEKAHGLTSQPLTRPPVREPKVRPTRPHGRRENTPRRRIIDLHSRCPLLPTTLLRSFRVPEEDAHAVHLHSAVTPAALARLATRARSRSCQPARRLGRPCQPDRVGGVDIGKKYGTVYPCNPCTNVTPIKVECTCLLLIPMRSFVGGPSTTGRAPTILLPGPLKTTCPRLRKRWLAGTRKHPPLNFN